MDQRRRTLGHASPESRKLDRPSPEPGHWSVWLYLKPRQFKPTPSRRGIRPNCKMWGKIPLLSTSTKLSFTIRYLLPHPYTRGCSSTQGFESCHITHKGLLSFDPERDSCLNKPGICNNLGHNLELNFLAKRKSLNWIRPYEVPISPNKTPSPLESQNP